jgi:hypothetical protein
MGNIVTASSVIVCLIGLFRFKKLTMPFKLLVIWLIIDLSLDSCSKLCIAVYKNNALESHVESMLEYSAYAIIYYYLFVSPGIKKVIIYSIPIIIILSIIDGCFFQGFTKSFPTYPIMTEEILYVVFAILLFKQMLQYPVQVNITKQSVFWFNTGMVFFSSTMFVNFSLMNYYTGFSRESLSVILFFWYSIDIVFNILFIIAILNDNKAVLGKDGQQS